MEANIGLMLPQAEQHQGATENGDQEESFMGPSWGAGSCPHLDFGLWPPEQLIYMKPPSLWVFYDRPRKLTQ